LCTKWVSSTRLNDVLFKVRLKNSKKMRDKIGTVSAESLHGDRRLFLTGVLVVAADRYQKDEAACLAVIVVSIVMTSTLHA
jgi:hypothetical protein